MKTKTCFAVISTLLSVCASAADGQWSGTVLDVSDAQIVTGSSNGNSLSGIGAVISIGAMLAGSIADSLFTVNQKASVKRLNVRLDDGIETTFDVTPAAMKEMNLEVGSQVLVKRMYSGGFEVTRHTD